MRKIDQEADMWLSMFSEPNLDHHSVQFMMIEQPELPSLSESLLLPYDQKFHDQSISFHLPSTFDKEESDQQQYQDKNVSFLPTPIKNMESTASLEKKTKGCKCKKSNCIKSYCECYSSGGACSKDCSCLNCENTINATEMGYNKRRKTKQAKKNGGGCSCKKTKCLKKYCECFNSGRGCSPECRCEGCQNSKQEVGEGGQENQMGRTISEFPLSLVN